MKRILLVAVAAALITGCANIYTRTRAYLGVPEYQATVPEKVQILSAEPKGRPHDRLGEVFLDVGGSPSRATLEKKLRKAAANLGADAVFIVQDEMHIFPVVYVDWWGSTVSQDSRRGIVAVAVKFK